MRLSPEEYNYGELSRFTLGLFILSWVPYNIKEENK